VKPPFSFLLVHGDGSRVLRFCLPRWIAYGTLGLITVLPAVAVGRSGLLLERQRGEISTLRRRMDAQRVLIDSSRMSIAAVRSELTVWRALHAKMRAAFGPDDAGADGTAAPTEPSPSGGQLRLGDEVEQLATSVAEEGPRLRELERLVSRTDELLDALPVRWPLRGKINSEFGMRRSPWTGRPQRHEGIDISGPPGTPVRSPAIATVIAASSHGAYGRQVTLEHGNGVRSLYGHLLKLEVKVGQKVEKGQVIGLVGSTGRSTGPHLHYELLVDGKPVDPRRFLGGAEAPTAGYSPANSGR
jgi:murein DD-endopeptidase MepM/ murein hydrolase activator NlpD